MEDSIASVLMYIGWLEAHDFGMRTFRPYDLDQPYLLPPDLRSWLSEGHLALFVSDVVDALDLSAILDEYERGDGRGYPPYHPVMMVKLLVYGYCTGKTSSRKVEKATWEDVAYRVLSGNQQPDHDSIADFRRRHLKALAGLFVQVLKLCREAGLVKLGHVSVDGSKVKANASRHKAMSYQRMSETEARLVAEVEALLAEAEAMDKAEDAQYGKGKRGDELPDELKRRDNRLKAIREAKAALEAEAKEKAEAAAEEARKRIADRERQESETGKKIGGVPPRIPDPETAAPSPKAQKNFYHPLGAWDCTHSIRVARLAAGPGTLGTRPCDQPEPALPQPVHVRVSGPGPGRTRERSRAWATRARAGAGFTFRGRVADVSHAPGG